MEVRRLLKGGGVEHYFFFGGTWVDGGSRKPAPEFFRFALGKGGVEKDSVLFVCNQLNTDVLGAERYGIRTAWLSGPEFHSVDETMTLADTRPSFIISDLTQLPSLLQKIAWL